MEATAVSNVKDDENRYQAKGSMRKARELYLKELEDGQVARRSTHVIPCFGSSPGIRRPSSPPLMAFSHYLVLR